VEKNQILKGKIPAQTKKRGVKGQKTPRIYKGKNRGLCQSTASAQKKSDSAQRKRARGKKKKKRVKPIAKELWTELSLLHYIS